MRIGLRVKLKKSSIFYEQVRQVGWTGAGVVIRKATPNGWVRVQWGNYKNIYPIADLMSIADYLKEIE